MRSRRDWIFEGSSFLDFVRREELTPADYARGRLIDFNYYYKSFALKAWWGDDAGHPGRFVYQVFVCEDDASLDLDGSLDWSEVTLSEQGTKKQVRFLVGREMGKVLELKFQRVPASGDLKGLFTLKGDDCARFVELVKSLDYLPVDGTEEGHRVSGELVRRVLTDPNSIQAAYEQDPDRFVAMITSNVNAKDVIALASRREQVAVFRQLLNDPDFFAERRSEVGARGPEEVWQKFFEQNPWILGVGLSGQLLTSWDRDKLEQIVVGASAVQAGKRTDALMMTLGAINSMVFAEIKHHRTDLLHQVRHSYRPAVWAPSTELTGGVTQIQQTVHTARDVFKEQVLSRDGEGRQDGNSVWFIRPRCFLVAGHMSEIAPGGAVNPDKFRSFELYRRNLYEPEIITYDELLARAEWHLAEAERDAAQDIL